MTPVKLKENTIKILNERLGDEYTAHYFYKCASNYCKNVGYFNAASFFEKESQSELEHANGLMNYMTQWNVQPTIPQVKTNHSFKGLVQVIEGAYKLEYDLFTKYTDDSKKILVADLNTFDFLQEYRKIQAESVAEYSDMLNELELIDKEDKFQLYMFEKEHFE